MYHSSAGKFAAWFNEKYPGAPRQITAEDVEDMKACELIHIYGFYGTRLDGKTIMGILKYEQLREQRSKGQPTEVNQEPSKCKICGEPLTTELEGKSGRPKEYCSKCSPLRNRERRRKSRRRRMKQ